ncbi:MAG: sodium-dependent transporter [Kiritimatiellia bacterium]
MNLEIREEQRESWGTRPGFVLAAVGSAVGLGNLWGFPYKLYSFGGGAFLIPYLIALFVVGIPLMILEFSLGHYTQRAAPDAFGKVHPRFEAVGWWGVILGFVIVTYYPVILAWCWTFLWHSLVGICRGGELPWAGEGIEGVRKATGFFFNDYLQHTDGCFRLGAIQWHIALPLLLTWIAMYLCIFKGVKLVGKVVWLTVPIPWAMILILAVRGLTLEGSGQGLAFYLNPEWSELVKPSTWRYAFGQVFFSLSLAFGVMITYSSFLHRKSDINNNAAIISLADLATSFVAGLAVFATLGGMAYATQQAGNPVPVDNVVDKGPGLAFVAFPYALAQLPGSAWFSFIFFAALLTLGIDSAFSITESVLASIVDKTGWHRKYVLPVMSLVGLGTGLVFVTAGSGLNWLGVIDGFINGTWGIAFMGLLECVVLGWLYRVEKLRAHANDRSDWRLGGWWDFLVRAVIPVVLSTLVFWNLLEDFSTEGGFIVTGEGKILWHNVVGLIVVAAAPVLAFLISLVKSPREKDPVQDLPIASRGGAPALLLAVIGAALTGWALVTGLPLLRSGVPEASAWTMPMAVAGAATVAALIALVLGMKTVRRLRNSETNPSWSARWSGLLATIDIGGGAGLLLALQSARALAVPQAVPSPVETEASLSGAGHLMLGIFIAVMIVGFSWCFYRAIGGAGKEDSATAGE